MLIVKGCHCVHAAVIDVLCYDDIRVLLYTCCKTSMNEDYMNVDAIMTILTMI